MAFWRLNLLCSGARENTRKNSKVQNWQTLRAYNFADFWPIRVHSTSFESPNKYLLGLRKKNSLAALLIHITLNWNTPKSYHKMTIDREWVTLSVSLTTKDSYDVPKSLVLFSFTCWQLKISKNLKKNVTEETNWVGRGSLFLTPCTLYHTI